MQAVILAGGLGTRISEETSIKPKPMVEIGGKPILWHIMKIYSSHKINEFIICCGYKGFAIKEYFSNYFLHNCDVTYDLRNNNNLEIHEQMVEPWKVTLVDTGQATQTGGRIKRIEKYLKDEEFCLTYGDGVADVNITNLISFHQKYNKKCTLTAVQPPGRFGALVRENELITNFTEKPSGDSSWVNGGFFVIKKEVIDIIEGDDCVFEHDILPKLARRKELVSYNHDGFWQPMDTLRDKNLLENIWSSGEAPWRKW